MKHITREMVREAEGSFVLVDGAVLMEYVRASRELCEILMPQASDLSARDHETVVQWEIAHATICGNVNNGRSE